MILLPVGLSLTVLFWPEQTPVKSPQFLSLAVGAPIVFFLLLLGLRLYVFDRSKFRYRLLTEERVRLHSLWSKWASREMQVMAVASVTPMELTPEQWSLGDGLPVSIGRAVRFEAKKVPGNANLARAKILIERLIEQMAETIARLPKDAALEVLFVLSEPAADQFELLKPFWSEAWQKRARTSSSGLQSPTRALSERTTISQLFELLEQRPERAVLLVAIQLSAMDGESSLYSEGATAFLVRPPEYLARSSWPQAHAVLYRPQQAKGDNLRAQLQQIREFQPAYEKVRHFWHSGVTAKAVSEMRNVLNDTPASKDKSQSWHEVDAVLGIPGPLNAWIALGWSVAVAKIGRVAQLLAVANAADGETSLCIVSPHNSNEITQ